MHWKCVKLQLKVLRFNVNVEFLTLLGVGFHHRGAPDSRHTRFAPPVREVAGTTIGALQNVPGQAGRRPEQVHLFDGIIRKVVRAVTTGIMLLGTSF